MKSLLIIPVKSIFKLINNAELGKTYYFGIVHHVILTLKNFIAKKNMFISQCYFFNDGTIFMKYLRINK